MRQSQDWAAGTGHLLTLWSAAVRQTLHPDIDAQIKARLTEHQGWRYDREHSRKLLVQQFRTAQLAGRDIGTLIHQITAAPLDDGRSISAILHHRMQQLTQPSPVGHGVTWAQRTPRDAPSIAHELAAGLDARARALGEQLATSPEPWLARLLGVIGSAASPAMRADYTRRAATAAAYREAAGITNPNQAVSGFPHRSNAELENLRQAAIRALEIGDDANMVRSMAGEESGKGIREAGRSHVNGQSLAGPGPQPDRVSKLLAQASAAVQRAAAESAGRRARAEYTARTEREAHAQPEPIRYPQVDYDPEMGS